MANTENANAIDISMVKFDEKGLVPAVVQEENGQWHALFLADVVSGAMLKNIVDRAKTRAVKESIETGLDVALTVPLLAAAVEDEYRETRDSMADVDPEQWSRINGMDPIRRIRTAE